MGTPSSCSEGRGCQELLELGRQRSDGKVEAGGLRAPIINVQEGSEDTGDCWLLTADLRPLLHQGVFDSQLPGKLGRRICRGRLFVPTDSRSRSRGHTSMLRWPFQTEP